MHNLIPYNLFEMSKHDYYPYLLEFFHELTVEMKTGFCFNQLKKLYDEKKKVKIGLTINDFNQNYVEYYSSRIEDQSDTDANIHICDIKRKSDETFFNIFIVIENDKIQLLCFSVLNDVDEKNDIIYECRFADLLSKNYNRMLKKIFSDENMEIIAKITN